MIYSLISVLIYHICNYDHKAVCCDLCESWVHVSCDPSLFDDLYANVVQEPSTDTWCCTVCFKLATVPVSDNYCRVNYFRG